VSDRGVAAAAIAFVIAVTLGALLFVGAAGARGVRAGDVDARVFFGDRPPPAARTIAQIQERVPGAVRPLVPVQRQVAFAFSEAAGYLLVLLGVATALVFARGPVVAGYRASLGGWRTQLRALALGGALMAVIASALFLVFVVMLGVVAGPPGAALQTPVGPGGVGRAGFALGPASLLQVGITAIAVAVVLIAVVGAVGLAAASWRIGDKVMSLRQLARFGQSVPPTLMALLGVSLIYVLTQIPIIGPVVMIGAVAYALGIVAAARLAPAPAPAP
jgi:hypothetical protein